MNTVQMQYEFMNQCRNFDILRGMDISTDDIEMYLNNAQNLVTDKYAEIFNKEDYARTYLSPLVTSYRFILTDAYQLTSSLENAYTFELPVDFRCNIPELEEVSMTIDSKSYRSRVKPVIGQHYNLNKQNPFKKPYEDMVWRLHNGMDDAGQSGVKSHQIVIPSGAILIYYFINYIKQPQPLLISVNTTCELATDTHDEIVITAVNLFLASVKNKLSLDKIEKL